MMAIKQKGFTEPVLAEEKKVWETKIPRGGRTWLMLVYPNEGAINTLGRQKVVKATPFLPAWGKLADFKHFIKTLKGNALNREQFWLLARGVGCGRTWPLLICISKKHKAKFKPQTSKPGFMGLKVQNCTGRTQQQPGAVPGHHLESAAPGPP